MLKGEKKSMKNVITKTLEYHSVIEELPVTVDKTYLCRVIVGGSYGKFSVCYWTLKYNGDGKWDIVQGIVTHWAEIPEVYDIDDNKIL